MSADLAVLLAEMQADFIDELPERCHRIEQRVLALEHGEAGAFDELYREVHSLKGSGGMFGVPVITTICHQLESFLAEVDGSFGGEASGMALAYVDLLRRAALPAGRTPQGAEELKQGLELLRLSNLSGRAAVLVVEPSEAMRKLYEGVFAGMPVQLVAMDSGLAALERMLHEPFDLLVASRELGDLNAVALLAALRESGGRNKDVAAILISSNAASVPSHLGVRAVVRRDPQLIPSLSRQVTQLLGARAGRRPA